MVWQRAGTVSVQNGSTTVTGADVDFAASSRVGDSFVGPDGATYEVANVASATVISILPAYKGATVTGEAYAIMPVQGYDKMLSDAFNSLNNQFGPKLAALGTTGNYDILPIGKGGTGASSAAAARQALGADVTLATAVLDPQTAGGLMSSTVVSGWTIEKFANGSMQAVSSVGNTPSIPVNAVNAISFSIPSGFIGEIFPNVQVQPLGNVDSYGVVFTYFTSATVIVAGVRNGATGAQAFLTKITLKGRWKT